IWQGATQLYLDQVTIKTVLDLRPKGARRDSHHRAIPPRPLKAVSLSPGAPPWPVKMSCVRFLLDAKRAAVVELQRQRAIDNQVSVEPRIPNLPWSQESQSCRETWCSSFELVPPPGGSR